MQKEKIEEPTQEQIDKQKISQMIHAGNCRLLYAAMLSKASQLVPVFEQQHINAVNESIDNQKKNVKPIHYTKFEANRRKHIKKLEALSASNRKIIESMSYDVLKLLPEEGQKRIEKVSNALSFIGLLLVSGKADVDNAVTLVDMLAKGYLDEMFNKQNKDNADELRRDNDGAVGTGDGDGASAVAENPGAETDEEKSIEQLPDVSFIDGHGDFSQKNEPVSEDEKDHSMDQVHGDAGEAGIIE